MKEGGTSLNKTFREYNLVFKGLKIFSSPVVVSASWWKARFKTDVTDSTLWQNCNVIQNYLVYL